MYLHRIKYSGFSCHCNPIYHSFAHSTVTAIVENTIVARSDLVSRKVNVGACLLLRKAVLKEEASVMFNPRVESGVAAV